MIYLGADHAGYTLKEKVKRYLTQQGLVWEDLGALKLDIHDDYPDYAIPVARAVAKKNRHRGFLFCGSGNGMAMAANRIKGIRAAVCWNAYTAKKAVEDNQANIISLPTRLLRPEEAIQVIKVYLATKPARIARHERRVEKIRKLDK
ncbi:MAG: RpiB/LacA/LacB family sugar-phosphate isomerase [Candidatus Komeilibacteria bacterium]|nr:RpiB/LacA/LacB family sugar-phosphate isomerase [Candidatus Komeilibacteria bacterium]